MTAIIIVGVATLIRAEPTISAEIAKLETRAETTSTDRFASRASVTGEDRA